MNARRGAKTRKLRDGKTLIVSQYGAETGKLRRIVLDAPASIP